MKIELVHKLISVFPLSFSIISISLIFLEVTLSWINVSVILFNKLLFLNNIKNCTNLKNSLFYTSPSQKNSIKPLQFLNKNTCLYAKTELWIITKKSPEDFMKTRSSGTLFNDPPIESFSNSPIILLLK